MAHSQNIHLRATFPHLFIRPVVRRLQFHCKTHPHQRGWGNRDEVLKNEVWLWSSLRLRSHGIGRIFLRSHGPTLTVRKFRPLAAQISVWTDRKYWTVPREQSVLSNFSAGRNSSDTEWAWPWCGTKQSAHSFALTSLLALFSSWCITISMITSAITDADVSLFSL